MRRAFGALTLAGGLLLAGACADNGQTDESSGEAETNPPEPPPSSQISDPELATDDDPEEGGEEDDVLEHLEAENRVVTLADGTVCEIGVVVTGAPEVAAAEDAGETLAKSPDDAVAVTLTDADIERCQVELTERLATYVTDE
ncbi:hypothetical protein [Nocardioides sp. SYSU DS0651]|uniref:hypothetical protein n=1 Tax=Nocardioides sp. SYSU DS0651 TaxID=3415955 RepID=UPI003F4C0AB6